jgi:hypothetical protein
LIADTNEPAYFEEDLVLLAYLDDIRMAHERVQVDLVDSGEWDTLVDELLNMLHTKV